jgi:hypothetical protein
MSGQTSTQQASQPKTQSQRPICCKSCGQVVAKRADQGACVEGEEHTFRNPAGYSFHVIVFSQALGCKQVGPAVAQDSWFPGYAWQISVCEECETHLGWYFNKGGESFHGLIVTRLSGL